MNTKIVSLFACSFLALPTAALANEALSGPQPGDRVITESDLAQDAASDATEVYYGHYICGSYVNVRGPAQGGGYAGYIIGTASYGERVALQGQSYSAWAGGSRNTFVRVRFALDGAFGYVGSQFLCRL